MRRKVFHNNEIFVLHSMNNHRSMVFHRVANDTVASALEGAVVRAIPDGVFPERIADQLLRRFPLAGWCEHIVLTRQNNQKQNQKQKQKLEAKKIGGFVRDMI